MVIHYATLPNGVRLVHYPVASKIAHLGVFINAGTRDELPSEHGIAHLIEHTIFKGTRKRNLFQVLNRLENVGADLNAYTTKEETCIYATFLAEHYDRTIELFHDIFFNSIFPDKEIEKEKQVVIDEIKSYHDNPAEQIFDDFEDLIFAGHPLGKNILGTAKSLKKIDRSHILNFIRRNYQLDQLVLASAGNIHFEKLKKTIGRYFSEIPDRDEKIPRASFIHPTVTSKTVNKKTYQVHCVNGASAYSFADNRRIPLALICNMLGGPALNSRLSLSLRERNGLTYHSEANYTAYSDAGIASIYFGTDPVNFEKALAIVIKELKRLREERLTPLQLHHIQKQLTGQLAIAQESNLAVMLTMGKSFMLQDRFDSIEEIEAQIMRVDQEKILEIANDIFDEKRQSILVFNS